MATLTTKDIDLQVSDGTTMGAYLARPSGSGPYPGVLVFQEIFGVNHHIRSVTDRIAALGYVALAPDLFHRTAPGFQIGYDDFAPGQLHAQAMTPAGVHADVKSAYDWLMSDPVCDGDHIATIGFCMGGRISFATNRTLPIQAAISFYGGGIAQSQLERVDQVQAPVLLFWGGQDKHIPPADVQAVANALRDAGKPFVNVEFGYADHGFFCDERGSYNAKAAKQAWALTEAFLAEHLGG
jgi:carboxymethylenebutenolidase